MASTGSTWIRAAACCLLIGTGCVLCDRQGPRFQHEPPSHVTFHNSSGTVVPCSAQGIPAPTITWLGPEGQRLTEVTGLRRVRSDGTLVFPPFRNEDFRQDVHATTVRCQASNVVGSIISRDVRIRAVLTQNYNIQVHDAFVTLGNTGVLRCHVPNFVRDDVDFLGWKRDEERIDTSAHKDKFVVLPTGELYILNVTQKDGIPSYRCQVRNKLTRLLTTSISTAKLIVSESATVSSPRITNGLSLVTSQEGNTAHLACAAQANPVPTYKWYREEDGHLRAIFNNRRYQQRSGIMSIEYTAVSDSGKYVCFVNNSEGEYRLSTTLLVTAPLSVVISPEISVADVGKPISLNCTVKGHPVHRIVWLKDGRPLVADQRITFRGRDWLHLSAAQRGDEGMYQCLAYGDDSSAQGIAEMKLGDVAPSFKSGFQEELLYPGSSFSLRCVATGNPLPQVTWRVGGVSIPDTHRYRLGDFVTSDGHVVSYVNISEVRVEDGGDYACTAANAASRTTHSARINVVGDPVIRPMPNRTALAGEVVEFLCPVSGYPIQAITWEKDGTRLPTNHRQRPEAGGRLTVSSLERPVDEGEYACVAKNAEGRKARGSFHLRIHVAPKIDPQLLPEVIYADEGKRVKLLCSVAEGDPRIKVTWSKDSSLTVPVGQGISLQNLEDSSVLVFRKVNFKDKGNYTCTASNNAAMVNRTTQLIVKVPPKWSLEPSPGAVVLGRPLVLNCLADGFPVPSVTWKKAKGQGSPTMDFEELVSSFRRQIFGNGTLSVLDTEASDAGHYLCQANNGVGAGLSKVIRVTVHYPPRFEQKFSSQSVRRGDSTVLKCQASGEQPLKIAWEKDRLPLDTKDPQKDLSVQERLDNGMVISELTIGSASRQDSALYTCVSTNSFGKDETNLQLIVQEPPSPPTGLSVQRKTSRSVTLVWTVGLSGNSPITKFLIQHKNLSSVRWEGETTAPSSAADVVVHGLLPATGFQFRIRSENAIGSSEPSETVAATTDEEVPGAPPEEVTVEATGSQSVKVSWKPPRKEHQYGVLLGYYIGYKIATSTEPYQYKRVEIGGNSDGRSTYLTNLSRKTQYGVIVQAYNALGAGPRSDEVMVTTLEAAPPTSPVLMVTSTTTSSITVQWERGQGDTSVKEYLLHFKVDKGDWKQKRVTTHGDTYTLEQLRCGTNYLLRMSASNSLGTGEPRPPVSGKTKGDPPISPTKEAFLLINSTSVTLLLSAWLNGGCAIDHFAVHYRPKFMKDWLSNGESIPATQERHVVRTLIPGREYVIKVYAFSVAGTTEAQYSFFTLNSTHDKMASSPSTVEAVPFYRNLAVLLAVLVSIGVLVIVVIALLVCLRRQGDPVTADPRDEGPERQQESNVLMSEFPVKDGNKGGFLTDSFGKGSYYSSPTRKPVPITAAVKKNKNRKDDIHEYAEPYSGVQDFTTMKNEGPYATIKRSPPRPGLQFVSLTQSLESKLLQHHHHQQHHEHLHHHSAHQQGRHSSLGVTSYPASSQSGSSGDRTSCSDHYKAYRSEIS